jgi:hypothetical protein
MLSNPGGLQIHNLVTLVVYKYLDFAEANPQISGRIRRYKTQDTRTA